jgi:outer membrane receptor protein involved in Fe transport
MQDADPGTIEDVIRPTYVVGDMQLHFAPTGNMWSISAWVRNFTNKVVWNTATWNSNGLITATLQDPRTYGITLSAKFGGG